MAQNDPGGSSLGPIGISNLVTSGLSSIGGIVGGILGASQSRKNTNKTISAAYDLADLAYQRNLEQWERENAYNTPAMQMQRLVEAGLNPNLIYGSGSATTTSAKSPQYDSPNVDYSGRRSSAASAAQSIMATQGIQQTAATIDNIKAQNKLIRAQAAKTDAERLRSEFDLGLESDLRESTYTKRYNDSLASTSRLGIAESQNQIMAVQADIASQTRHDVIAKVRQDAENARKQGLVLDASYKRQLAETTRVELDNRYREMGISPTDNALLRIVSRIMSSIFPDWKF